MKGLACLTKYLGKIPAIVTFFHAALFGLFYLPNPSLSQELWAVVYIVCLVSLGLAVLKRHLWGACALVVYALILRASPFYVSGYGIGAIALYYSDHVAPKLKELNWKKIGWFALLLYGGSGLIGFIFGVAAPHISEMQKAQLLQGISGETWGIVASTVAMRRIRVWPLETQVAVWPWVYYSSL